MCFESTNTKRYIAEEDIPCYKMVWDITSRTCKSFHTYFGYEFGELYTLLNSQSVQSGYMIDENPDGFLKPQTCTTYGDDIMIDIGFHSYIEQDYRAHVKCIIPKGSEYYMNDEEYVSNQLIIKEQI